MSRMVLRGAKVLLNGIFAEKDVAVENGKIAQIGDALQGEVKLVSGYLIPGLIDEHIHGIFGNDTMYGADAVVGMSKRLVMHGVTGFLPTTMNAGVEETHAALMGVKQAMQNQPENGAVILGAHMEGPFLGKKYKGAQDARANLLPCAENFEKLTKDCEEVVRLITIAPELAGAEAFVRYACERGIVVSAGHTDARYEQMQDAASWGVRQVTHLFNGMNPLHHRNPGVPCAALTLEVLSPQVIADGIHLHPAAVKLAVRNANVLLITDSLQAADMPDGVYDLGGQDVFVKDGIARIAAGNLAGSTLTLERAVYNAMNFAGITLAQAVEMASTRVAESLGLKDRGRIVEGLRADMCLVDENMNVRFTMIEGNVVYCA